MHQPSVYVHDMQHGETTPDAVKPSLYDLLVGIQQILCRLLLHREKMRVRSDFCSRALHIR